MKDSMQNDRLSNKQSQLLFEHNMPGLNSELLVDKLLFISYFCGLVERKVFLSNVDDYRVLFKFIDDYHFFSFVILNENNEIFDELTEIDLFKRFGMQ